MTIFSRETAITDGLIILGLVTLGAGIHSFFGLPATLIYTGVVLVVIGLALAALDAGGDE